MDGKCESSPTNAFSQISQLSCSNLHSLVGPGQQHRSCVSTQRKCHFSVFIKERWRANKRGRWRFNSPQAFTLFPFILSHESESKTELVCFKYCTLAARPQKWLDQPKSSTSNQQLWVKKNSQKGFQASYVTIFCTRNTISARPPELVFNEAHSLMFSSGEILRGCLHRQPLTHNMRPLKKMMSWEVYNSSGYWGRLLRIWEKKLNQCQPQILNYNISDFSVNKPRCSNATLICQSEISARSRHSQGPSEGRAAFSDLV